MLSQQKKFLKVSYLGETKRLKIVNDYPTLLNLCRQAFDSQELPKVIKFYYLDDENEIISINSQSDLNEALDIEDLSALKLTVASSAVEARKQLEKHITDNMVLAESLNNSQFLGSMRSARFSDFHMIGGDELQQKVQRSSTQRTHEIACGGNDALGKAVDIATDVHNLMRKEDQASNTAAVTVKDSADGGQPIKMNDMGCQNGVKTQDAGCESLRTMTSSIGTQNERNVKEQSSLCEIIIPDEEEAIQQETITCFKCLGSKVNRKGLPCRKCNGMGTITSKEIMEVVQIVREEVSQYCTSQFKMMFRDYLTKKQEEQKSTVFNDIACDGCDMAPVRGVRYMCSVCSNYDLCENCERAGVHAHHPMLKIRAPAHAPSKLVCQYKPGVHEMQAQEQPKQFEAKPEVAKSEVKMSGKHSKPDKIKYSARFVKESIPDKYKVAPGATFSKTWTMRNDGVTGWPEDVILIQTNGDNMGAAPVAIEGVVAPQSEYDWVVNFTAPEKEGQYCAYFRMAFGDNVRFGHKIWCNILVEAPEVVKVEEVPLIKAEPVQLNDISDFVVLQDKSGEKPQVIEEVKEDPNLKLSISSVFQSPKDLYFAAVEKETDKDLKDGLLTLYEFGFVEYKVNKTLLCKYKYNTNTVAEVLLHGALNESTFVKIFEDEQKEQKENEGLYEQ